MVVGIAVRRTTIEHDFLSFSSGCVALLSIHVQLAFGGAFGGQTDFVALVALARLRRDPIGATNFDSAACRKKKKRGTLAPEKVTELEALGFEWDVLKENWERSLADLKRYKQSHCGVDPVQAWVSPPLTMRCGLTAVAPAVIPFVRWFADPCCSLVCRSVLLFFFFFSPAIPSHHLCLALTQFLQVLRSGAL
jgi:hypothetical protein